MILEDNSPMPFGQYENTPMDQVPARYLKWIMDNVFKSNKGKGADSEAVRQYIIRNWGRIKQEAMR